LQYTIITTTPFLEMLNAPPLLAVHVWSDGRLTDQGKYFGKLTCKNTKTPALFAVQRSVLLA
jgi:hypothetical protein